MSPRRCVTHALLAALVVVCAVGLACGGKKGPPKKKQIILATEYHDQMAGAEAAQEVAQSMGILEDTPPVVYAKAVGARMAKFAPHSSFKYNFEVVDQIAPNAFALPGGYIYLSRGLLALSNSEDELANVIGHEITHAVERHAAGRQAYEQRLNPFMMGYMRAGEVASYGRDHERDADRGAQLMAGLAGYDPEGMAQFLRSLDNTTRLQLGFSRRASFFDTHPSTPERAATASQRAKEIRWERKAGITKSRDEHLRKLEGLLLGDNPAQGVFDENRFLHVDLDFSLRFPPGWITINGQDALVAWEPTGQAQLVLRVLGDGDDPQKAGEQALEKQSEHFNVKVTRQQLIKLNDMPAYRVEADSSGGGVATSSEVTWFAYNGLIYELSVVARHGAVARYFGRGRSTARSFRPLTPEERQSVMERRLHIVEAREGETLRDLSERSGNVIDFSATAVLNNLSVKARLPAGFLVKVGTARPYVPKQRLQRAPATPAQ